MPLHLRGDATLKLSSALASTTVGIRLIAEAMSVAQSRRDQAGAADDLDAALAALDRFPPPSPTNLKDLCPGQIPAESCYQPTHNRAMALHSFAFCTFV